MQSEPSAHDVLITDDNTVQFLIMVCVEIEDNGSGMTGAVRKRVFEPFFTTKDVGVGTGLGLSVSYFIVVENHGGRMAVESSPGVGAKFTVMLPLVRRRTNAD